MAARGLKALIIDDDAVLRRVVREALARGEWDLEMEEAGDGAQGARLAAGRRHDVILLDYQLPDLDGLQVLERIAAFAPGVPVVALTGQGSEDVAVRFMRGGAADYLTKEGLTPQRLVQTVRNVVSTRRMAGEVTRLEQAVLHQERAALVGALSETALRAFREGVETLSLLHERLWGQATESTRETHEEAAAILSGLREVEASLWALRGLLSSPEADARVDVDGVVADVVRMYRVLSRAGIRLETDLAARTEARASPHAVRQMLLHLLNNAMEAMPEGGAVTVSTRSEEGQVALVVEDEGSGVPRDLAPRIFELFASGKPDHEGVGLTLVRHLALQHGGSVVHVPRERGARFVVRLPTAA